MMAPRRAAIVLVLSGLFVIGFSLMGFEMLGSRYLNPYFGGGITTWASLISVVLLAMMLGYFAGGYVVDSHPGIEVLVISVLVAGISLLLVPVTADSLIETIIGSVGDGFWGVLAAAFCLSFIPVGLLSACSPYVVRLLLIDLNAGGKTTGLVYAVSTFGNVAGTLVTTFYLIPGYGTRTITTTFGLVLIALALLIFLLKGRITKGLVSCMAATIFLPLAAVVFFSSTAPVNAAPATGDILRPEKSLPASYPEGPIWQGELLYFAEMPLHRVMRLGRTGLVKFWSQPGCGPTSIAPYRRTDFIVLCHLAAKVVHVSSAGETVSEFEYAPSGDRFQDPNDCYSDGEGGVFFSDPGPFQTPSQATGAVYHIGADKKLTKIIGGLRYANGLTFDPATKRLLVSEHLARKVWEYRLGKGNAVKSATVMLDLKSVFTRDTLINPLVGPDGIEFDGKGNVVLAVYGAGRLLVVTPQGTVKQLFTDMKFVTNIAISSSGVAVVGAFNNDRPPFPGEVQVYAAETVTGARNGQVLSSRK